MVGVQEEQSQQQHDVGTGIDWLVDGGVWRWWVLELVLATTLTEFLNSQPVTTGHIASLCQSISIRALSPQIIHLNSTIFLVQFPIDQTDFGRIKPKVFKAKKPSLMMTTTALTVLTVQRVVNGGEPEEKNQFFKSWRWRRITHSITN